MLEALRPIFFVVGFVRLNPLSDRWIQRAFADEIRRAMPFLFDRYEGRVIPDPRPEANDLNMDYVCVGTHNLIFKFARWRRENYEVRVSPSFAPTDLYELVDALRVADSAANAQPLPEAESW